MFLWALSCKCNILPYMCMWGKRGSDKWLAQAQELRCTLKRCVSKDGTYDHMLHYFVAGLKCSICVHHLTPNALKHLSCIIVEFRYLANKDNIQNPLQTLTSSTILYKICGSNCDVIVPVTQEMSYLMEFITDAIYLLPISLKTDMDKSHGLFKGIECPWFYLLYIHWYICN